MLTAGLALLLLGLVAAVLVGVVAANEENGDAEAGVGGTDEAQRDRAERLITR